MTGSSQPSWNSVESAFGRPAMFRAYSITMHCSPRQSPSVGMPGVLDHHALQPEAEPERRDAVRTGVLQRADLALDTADAEAAGDAHGVDLGQVPGGTLLGLALVGGHPDEVHLRLVGEPAGAQR